MLDTVAVLGGIAMAFLGKVEFLIVSCVGLSNILAHLNEAGNVRAAIKEK